MVTLICEEGRHTGGGVRCVVVGAAEMAGGPGRDWLADGAGGAGRAELPEGRGYQDGRVVGRVGIGEVVGIAKAAKPGSRTRSGTSRRRSSFAPEMVGTFVQDDEAIDWDSGTDGGGERVGGRMRAIEDRVAEKEGMRKEYEQIWDLVEQSMDGEDMGIRGGMDGEERKRRKPEEKEMLGT